MNSEELIYFDSIKLYTVGQLRNNAKVYIASSCSNQFYNNLLVILSKYRVTRGTSRSSIKGKYDLIIDCSETEINIRDIIKYKDYLLEHGIIAIGSYNHEYFQSRSNIKKHSLNKKTDKLIAKYNLYPIFREPMGKFYKINKISDNNLLNVILSKVGWVFPYSRLYSPYKVLIYQLHMDDIVGHRYQSETTFKRRMHRFCTRKIIITKVYNLMQKNYNYLVKKNHPLAKLYRFAARVYRFGKRIIFSVVYAAKYNTEFRNKVYSSITVQPEQYKKVLVIAMTYLDIGGVERVMLNLIKGINRNLYSIHLITTVKSDNIWHEEFQKYVDHIVHIPEIITEDWPRKFRQRYVEEYVSRNKADILFITNSEATYKAIPTIKKRYPDIRIYDLLHTHGTPRDKDAYLRISMPFDKYINKRIVIDNYLKKYYVKKYPVDKNKIIVIYNGIDKNLISKMDLDTEDPLFSIIPKNRKIITYIGRLEIDKSPTRLVDIAIELKKRRLPISIVVVGNGSLRDSLVKQSIDEKIINKYIYFYGSSKNPLLLDKKSDFTLLVSNAEGIPMTILESMSVGTPAISSAVGGVPEIIDNTVDGFLVNINKKQSEATKVKAFTNAIINASKLTDKELQNMGEKAKEKISNKFSSMPENYEHLFETGKILD